MAVSGHRRLGWISRHRGRSCSPVSISNDRGAICAAASIARALGRACVAWRIPDPGHIAELRQNDRVAHQHVASDTRDHGPPAPGTPRPCRRWGIPSGERDPCPGSTRDGGRRSGRRPPARAHRPPAAHLASPRREQPARKACSIQDVAQIACAQAPRPRKDARMGRRCRRHEAVSNRLEPVEELAKGAIGGVRPGNECSSSPQKCR